MSNLLHAWNDNDVMDRMPNVRGSGLTAASSVSQKVVLYTTNLRVVHIAAQQVFCCNMDSDYVGSKQPVRSHSAAT